MMVELAFWTFAAAAVGFGVCVFRTDSMVRASFALLASFLNVAAVLVLLLAEYLGFALMFMMAVEMTVMALFMVAFMMNPAGLNPMTMVHQQRLSVSIGAGSTLALGLVAWWGRFPDRPVTTATDSVRDLGRELLGGSMLIFESAGVALLATMLGSVILATRSSRFGSAADAESLPPAIEPADSTRDADASSPRGGDA